MDARLYGFDGRQVKSVELRFGPTPWVNVPVEMPRRAVFADNFVLDPHPPVFTSRAFRLEEIAGGTAVYRERTLIEQRVEALKLRIRARLSRPSYVLPLP